MNGDAAAVPGLIQYLDWIVMAMYLNEQLTAISPKRPDAPRGRKDNEPGK